MEARVRTTFPEGGYAYEPKWDGFRALAWSGDDAEAPRLHSRNRKPLLRYFPELEDPLAQLPPGTVVDGEVVCVVDDRLSFDSLQLRLHPARSRNLKLAEEIPARLVAFDLLARDGEDVRQQPFRVRRERLVSLLAELDHPWHLTPSTTDVEVARRWFDEFEAAGCDGIVAKSLDGPYVEGERAMAKIKHRRTVDTVVAGWREHKDGGKVGSLLLGLYDHDRELRSVGFSSGLKDEQREQLYDLFQRYAAEDAFALDDQHPSEPSRWSADKDMSWNPLEPTLVAEVSFDQLNGRRFRHAARFERWRSDKDAEQCTFEQLDPPEGPGFRDVVHDAR